MPAELGSGQSVVQTSRLAMIRDKAFLGMFSSRLFFSARAGIGLMIPGRVLQSTRVLNKPEQEMGSQAVTNGLC